MKEALSKSLILQRLVNASRLRAGNAGTPPCLSRPLTVEMAAHRCPYNVSHKKKKGDGRWLVHDFHMRQTKETRQERGLKASTKGPTTAAEAATVAEKSYLVVVHTLTYCG